VVLTVPNAMVAESRNANAPVAYMAVTTTMKTQNGNKIPSNMTGFYFEKICPT